jgi:hypothetical protein
MYETDGIEDDPPLRVPGTTRAPVPLAAPLPAALVIVTEKDAGGTAHPCEIMALSLDGAELRAELGVEPMANVCLRIRAASPADGAAAPHDAAAAAPLEIHAKVTGTDAGRARLHVRFTAVTPDAAAWIRAVHA